MSNSDIDMIAFTEEDFLNTKYLGNFNQKTHTNRVMASRKYINTIKDHMLDAMEEVLKDKPKHKDQLSLKLMLQKSLVVGLGDLHFGKKSTSPKDRSVVTFNTEIATKRLYEIKDHIIDTYLSKKDCEYDELVLLLMGDVVEGDTIFATQKFIIEKIANEQVKDAQRVLTSVIKELSIAMDKVKGKVSIYGIPGNHGERRNGNIRDPKDNWDALVYGFIDGVIGTYQKEFKQYKNVFFEYSMDADQNLMDIKGWKAHMRHAAPKDLSSAKSEIAVISWSLERGGIDLFFTGHYHTEYIANVGKIKIIRNGSLCGADDFSDSIGALASRPQQFILTMSKENAFESYAPYIFKTAE